MALKRGADPVAFRLESAEEQQAGASGPAAGRRDGRLGRARGRPALGVAFIDYASTLMGGVAEVSVDRATGRITVHNFWCVMDCGLPVQPDTSWRRTKAASCSASAWR